MPKTRFRLIIDKPYSFATEQGYTNTRHCHDFRVEPGSLSETAYRDPVTGLVMLKPSYLTDDWYNAPDSWWAVPDWNMQVDFWQEMNRTGDMSAQNFLTTQDPGTSGGFIGTLVDIGIYAINKASVLSHDVVDWVLQSKADLYADEGFVLHYQALGDRFARFKNWFNIQWADVQLRFSPDGTVECYRHLNGVANEPTLWDTFEIASPGELLGKEGYFVFLPIP